MASAPPFEASDLNKFDIKAREAIALGIILNWTVRWANSKRTTVQIRRGATKAIIVPSTNVNANRARAWISQMLTHTPDEERRRLLYGDIDIICAEPNVARVVAYTGTTPIITAREIWEAKNVDYEQPHLTQKIAEVVAPPLPEFTPEKLATAIKTAAALREQPEPEPKPEPTEVMRTPLKVQRSGEGSEYYESKGVSEITYSDGSKRYGCRFCDRIEDRSRSIATHVGHAHKGMGTPDFLIELRNKEKAPVTTSSQPPAPAPLGFAVPTSFPAQGSSTPVPDNGLRGMPLLTHHLRTLMVKHDNARDVALGLLSLDFETRARLAHVVLMGRESETMRQAAEARIAEVEAERDAALRERDELQGNWDALHQLINPKKSSGT